MKIPKSVKVNGFIWDIKEDDSISYEGNCFGSTHYKTQSIYLEPDMPQQHKEQVLIHELMHTIFWQSGLSKRYQKTNPDMEEEVVTALSVGLYQVLKDNNFLK